MSRAYRSSKKGEKRVCNRIYSQRVGQNSNVLNVETLQRQYSAMNITTGRKRMYLCARQFHYRQDHVACTAGLCHI